MISTRKSIIFEYLKCCMRGLRRFSPINESTVVHYLVNDHHIVSESYSPYNGAVFGDPGENPLRPIPDWMGAAFLFETVDNLAILPFES